ncbi:cytochrome P450 [Amycolatopsis methanolica]|uniref:Cytochrome P450 n=1 Tax=Amycolatopsis methanolica 239 TaxID=1068978 RepID=A0A076MZC7_AMYME|nr:cytochrome P450 [Amycolatopsis methanolica]AIJ22987.1 cytochrome P450 [Amycolatopsis methanolica 239]
MNRVELALAVAPLPFLDAHADDPGAMLDVRGGPAPKVLVWHHETLASLFRRDSWLRHPASRSLGPLLGPKSMLWADGARHASYRKLLGPPLRGRRLAAYHGLIARAAASAIDALGPGAVFGLAAWTRRLALDIVARIVLGDADPVLLRDVTAWLDRALGSRHRTLAYRFLRGGLPASGAELDARLVAAAKSGREPRSLVSPLLTGNGPLGPVPDDELRDQVVSLLFAGHETTAAATAWTLYWLTRRADLRDAVLSELDATTDDGSDPAEVPVLQAVIAEALRLHPPVEFAGNRALPEAVDVHGRTLPAGTVLTPAIYLAHHRSEYFPSPLTFDPGRFLGRRGVPEGYLPFGGGSRFCLGSQLGQLEIRMITTALLRRRALRCVNPRAGVPKLRGHAMAPSVRLRLEVVACRD